jgi:PhnB protein
MAVKPIPEGHNRVSPYLLVASAARVIELAKRAFGAAVLHCTSRPDGLIGHAEVKIGDSVVMISDATAEYPAMPAMVHVYVEDVDAAYRRALDAGAESLREPADQFYGDRSAGVRDAGGNLWWIATHVEDVSAEEIERRAAALAPGV